MKMSVALAILLSVPSCVCASTLSVDARVLPATPYVEIRDGAKILNFDLMLHNTGDTPLRLVAIREAVYDDHGALEREREINANGSPSALAGLGDLILQPGAYKDVFQPFERYDTDADLSRLHFTLVFLKPDRAVPPVALGGDAVTELDVRPHSFRPAAYCLPLDGRILVHDGHDLASHHRRRDLARYAADPRSAVNANLYAYDFVRIDDKGALFHGDPSRKENWLTFRATILAPMSGNVVEAIDGVPDNSFVDGNASVPPAAEKIDPDGFGNHVLIRAADGRVSWLLHMEPGTVKVHKGEAVHAGQPLGLVGFSGDSLFPHLHYTVTDGATYPSQGVPSYFGGFAREPGHGDGPVTYGQVDTGDILLRDDRTACGG